MHGRSLTGRGGRVSLPVVPPVEPMLATLARELPAGDYVFEPKWDGFRCLAFRDGDDVDLRSRNQRAFARYFPEVVDALRAVGTERLVLDGELVTRDFPSLLARTHPAASRVARLAVETPARFVAFDLLAIGSRDLRAEPFTRRRAALEAALREAPSRLCVTPATSDRSEAGVWLDAPHPGIDGVVAKAPDLRYEAGKRTMVKVKRERTVDCVVAGARTDAHGVSSLLLGVFDGDALVHVGVASGFRRTEKRELVDELRPVVTGLDGHPWAGGYGNTGGGLARLPGAASHWAPGMTLDWVPLRPELVCEVGYDHLEGVRFRHPARFKRWRPDRDAPTCTVDQLR